MSDILDRSENQEKGFRNAFATYADSNVMLKRLRLCYSPLEFLKEKHVVTYHL